MFYSRVEGHNVFLNDERERSLLEKVVSDPGTRFRYCTGIIGRAEMRRIERRMHRYLAAVAKRDWDELVDEWNAYHVTGNGAAELFVHLVDFHFRNFLVGALESVTFEKALSLNPFDAGLLPDRLPVDQTVALLVFSKWPRCLWRIGIHSSPRCALAIPLSSIRLVCGVPDEFRVECSSCVIRFARKGLDVGVLADCSNDSEN